MDKGWKPLPTGNGYRTMSLNLNRSYLFTYQGILNFIEIFMSLGCTYLIMVHCRPAYSDVMLGFAGTASETYFMITSSICLAISFLHSFICFISESSYILLSRTLWVIFSHGAMFLMFIVISCYMLFTIGLHDPLIHSVYGFNWKLVASVLGLFNSMLYLVSTYLAWRSWKSSWLQ